MAEPAPAGPPPRLLAHVEVRVRDLARATDFYDGLLGMLGARRYTTGTRVSWAFVEPGNPDPRPAESFGITADAAMTPGAVRIAFAAPTRGVVQTVATLLPALGALEIDGPHDDGAGDLACFFSDPDGNRLEVVHRDGARPPRG